MLKLKPDPTFRWTVQISVPGAEPADLQVVFRHKGKQALQDWLVACKDKNDVAAMLEILESWEGVADQDGQSTPFSPEALAAFFDSYPAAPTEITQQYFDALRGARRKN